MAADVEHCKQNQEMRDCIGSTEASTKYVPTPPEVFLKFHFHKSVGQVLQKKSFPHVASLSITLPAPYTAILLSYYDQNKVCPLELEGHTKSPKNASTLSVKASLKNRIRTSDQAGTREYFVVQRETVPGELLTYPARKAALNSLFDVSKSWVSAVHFRDGDAEIGISIDVPLVKKGYDKNREPDWWL